MSDVAKPRTEKHYLHPKKHAWRSDNRALAVEQNTPITEEQNTPITEEQNTPITEEQNISSAIKERFNMVTNSSSINVDSNPQNGKSNEDDCQSPKQIDHGKPLDFTVKSLTRSEHIHDSELQRSPTESPIKIERISPNGKFASKYPNDRRASAIPIYNGKTSTVTNMNSKFKRIRLNSDDDTVSSPHSDHLRPENRRRARRTPKHVYNMFGSFPSGCVNNMDESWQPKTANNLHESQLPNHQNNADDAVQLAHFLNSTKYRQERNENVSFDGDSQSSPMRSSSLSSGTSPDNKNQYSGSILHGVLVGSSGEQSKIHATNSNAPTVNSVSMANSMQGPSAPQFIGPHSIPVAGLLMPNAGSVVSPTASFIPGARPGVAFFNSLGYSPATLNGINPYSNGGLLVPSLQQNPPAGGDKKQNKPVRPFKAITNEILYGIPTMGLPAMTPVVSPNGYYNNYFQGQTDASTDPPKDKPVPKSKSSETSVNSAMNSSPSSSSNEVQTIPDANGSGDSNISYPDATSSVMETTEQPNSRKRGRALPDELKDPAYWERRRKNNQAAKRSRDARRQKEDLVAQQAWYFREQNIKLHYELNALKEQNHILTVKFQNLAEHNRNLEIQIQLLNDTLHRERLRDSSRVENTENSLGGSNKSDSFEA